MLSDRPSNPAASLLEETLDSVVRPAARDAMLGAALADCGRVEVPSDPEDFRRFVQGPLRRALVRGLGEALAEAVLAELEITCRSKPPTLRPSAPQGRPGSSRLTAAQRAAWSSPPASVPRAPALPVIRHTGSPQSSAPRREVSAPPISGAVRQRPRPGAVFSAEFPAVRPVSGGTTVFAVTRDRRTAGSLAAWLGDRVPIIVARDLMGLVHAIDASPGAVLVVIDCHQPSVQPVAVAALAGEFDGRARFVLWGATAEDDRALFIVNPATRDWVRCEGEAPSDLAALCADLVS